MKPKTDKTRQINVRMRESVFTMLLDGCRETGLSQGRYLEFCIIRQAHEVPRMLARLRKEALHIITDEMADVAPGGDKR